MPLLFSAPLLVYISRNAPHKGIKGSLVSQTADRSYQIQQDILRQVLCLLASRSFGSAIRIYRFRYLRYPRLKLSALHMLTPSAGCICVIPPLMRRACILLFVFIPISRMKHIALYQPHRYICALLYKWSKRKPFGLQK